MYATVRQYENIQNSAEVVRQVNDSFLPIMKQIQGFVAYYFVDVGDSGGRMVSVSVFESEAGAEESNKRAIQWVSEHPGLVPPAARIEEGQVVVGN